MNVLRNFLISSIIACISVSSFASSFQGFGMPFSRSKDKEIAKLAKKIEKSGKSAEELENLQTKIEKINPEDHEWEVLTESSVTALSEDQSNPTDAKIAYSILESTPCINHKTAKLTFIYGNSALIKLVLDKHFACDNNIDAHDILLQLVLALKPETLQMLLNDDSSYQQLFDSQVPNYFDYIVRRSKINCKSDEINASNFKEKHEKLIKGIQILADFYSISGSYLQGIEKSLSSKLVHLRDHQAHLRDHDAFSSFQTLPMELIANPNAFMHKKK